MNDSNPTRLLAQRDHVRGAGDDRTYIYESHGMIAEWEAENTREMGIG